MAPYPLLEVSIVTICSTKAWCMGFDCGLKEHHEKETCVALRLYFIPLNKSALILLSLLEQELLGMGVQPCQWKSHTGKILRPRCLITPLHVGDEVTLAV